MAQKWFITGSSRGLGRDIVEAALAAGHTVAATARKVGDLDEFATRYGDRVVPFALDVNDAAACERAVKEAHDRLGGLDVVVNNAGYANTAALEDLALDDFEAQVQTNFFGTVYITKAAIPLLRAQGSGHIFQIASVGGRIASPGLVAYQSAKFAVRGFTLVVAQEVAPLGIKMTVVQPGGMRTDWAGSSMEVREVSEPYRQTVGAFAEQLRAHAGEESSDPAKVAQIIVDMAMTDDAPVDLLIGEDAYQYATEGAKATSAADEKWKDVSVSAAA